MRHEFFLSKKFLPADFNYPDSYIKFVSQELPDLDPWYFAYVEGKKKQLKGLSSLEFHFKGLKERYPKQVLIPFARFSGDDDVACFDASVPSDNPRVLLIHDFASEGWEMRGEFKDFLDWLSFAKEDAKAWHEFHNTYLTARQWLSTTVLHALQHEPWLYELELDNEGWVSIEKLLSALHAEKEECRKLTIDDLDNMIRFSAKKCHEIKDGKIRALYDHSISDKLIKEQSEPPEILYHGASPEVAKIILQEGLKPINRQYVHLSVDTEIAKQVGVRKSKSPVILVIEAQKAYRDGSKFYIGNEHVWLADYVGAEHIKIEFN